MRQVQTHYYAIRHYARSILVFLTMIFTNSAFEVTTVWRYRNLIIIIIISCLSTYPLRACQWLSNVLTPVSCNVYWLQSRVCTPGVGLLVMMIWLELCTSRSCICHHHLSHYNKVQNGDILVSADPDLSLKNGRWNGERASGCVVRCGCEWSYIVCIMYCMYTNV